MPIPYARQSVICHLSFVIPNRHSAKRLAIPSRLLAIGYLLFGASLRRVSVLPQRPVDASFCNGLSFFRSYWIARQRTLPGRNDFRASERGHGRPESCNVGSVF